MKLAKKFVFYKGVGMIKDSSAIERNQMYGKIKCAYE